jgi:hypothetical protein
VPAGAVTAALASDGRIVLASRVAGGSDVALHVGRGTEWTGVFVPLEGGVMPPALAVGPSTGNGGALAVACDDGSGAPAVLVVDLAELDAAESGGFTLLSRPWRCGDITVVKRPAIAFDAEGGLRLWAVAADGELWTVAAEPGGELAAGWERAA